MLGNFDLISLNTECFYNDKTIKTEFTRGPGRGDTCHLSFLNETLPD